MGAEPIVIISFGDQHQHFNEMMEWVENDADQYFIVPLRKVLNDPARMEDCPHYDDGDSVTVQIHLYSQEAFSECMLEIADAVMNAGAPRRIILYCRQGKHRAMVAARTLRSMFNRCADANGNRRFHAVHFPLHKARKLSACEATFAAAHEWMQEPYNPIGPELPSDHHSTLFGYEASQMRPICAQTFRAIYEWIDAENKKNLKKTPRAPDGPPWKRARVAAGGELVRSIRGRASSSTREEMEEIIERSSETVAKVSVEEDELDKMITPAQLITYIADADMPPWAVAGRVVMSKAWKEVLNEFGCDDTSQQELYALSQQGEEEYRFCNGILAKLLKKQADGDRLHNSSAFLHSCVRNWRNRHQWH